MLKTPKKKITSLPSNKGGVPKKKGGLKKLTMFKSKVRTRHKTHKPLRTNLGLLPFRSVVRLGSQTDLPDTTSHGGTRIECNTITAVGNSANKRKMKRCFVQGKVVTAKHYDATEFINLQKPEQDKMFPLVAKSLHGSRGKGNYLIKTQEEWDKWKPNKNLDNYIVEKFHDYNREYRLHVTADGCFYTCRKMLKTDTPEKDRWFRNDSNCSWIVETNPTFDKPVNWNKIVEECVKALKAVGLDIGACDVKVQSSNDKNGTPRPNPEFIIIEINSAPSFGEITTQKYLTEIPKILRAKKAKQ